MAINIVTSQTITRPSDTTAYAAGDLIANSTTAGSVTPFRLYIPRGLGKNLVIKAAGVTKSDETDVANSAFRLWFFASSPTVANGDNGALSANLVAAGYFGRAALSAMLAGTDDAFDRTALADSAWLYHYLGAADSIYGLLEATAAYSPASAETFNVHAVIDQS
jgi:hypothetical protein